MPYQSPALQRGAPLFYQLAGLEVMAHVLATVVMAQGQPGQPQPHRSPSATGRPEPPHTLSTWAKSPLLSLRSHIFSVEYLPRPTRSSDSLAGLVTVARPPRRTAGRAPPPPAAALPWAWPLLPPAPVAISTRRPSAPSVPRGSSRLKVATVDAAQAPWARGKGGGTQPWALWPASNAQRLERVRFSQLI